MSRSDYFKGLFDEGMRHPIKDQSNFLVRVNAMIRASLAVESKKISEEEYQDFYRDYLAADAADNEARRHRVAAAIAATLKTQSTPVTTNCTTVTPGQINCVSR